MFYLNMKKKKKKKNLGVRKKVKFGISGSPIVPLSQFCFPLLFFQQTFAANVDTQSIATIVFPESVCARYLRIIPTEVYYYAGLRFEVFGYQQC